MALLIDHDRFTMQPGSRDWGPVAVPDGLTQVTLRIARQTTLEPTFWEPGCTIDLKSWCSLDGGTTWLQWLGGGGPGGIIVGRNGEIAEAWVSARLPQGTGRLMRLTIVVTGARLVTELTVEVE